MVIVSEIADLAVESENLDEEGEFDEIGSTVDRRLQMQKSMEKRLWTSVKYLDRASSEDSNGLEKREEEEEEEEKKSSENDNEEQEPTGKCPHLVRSQSGSVFLKKQLENWDEPQSKLDKVNTICYDV